MSDESCDCEENAKPVIYLTETDTETEYEEVNEPKPVAPVEPGCCQRFTKWLLLQLGVLLKWIAKFFGWFIWALLVPLVIFGLWFWMAHLSALMPTPKTMEDCIRINIYIRIYTMH